jgi:alkaline phosphatase
MLTDFIAFDRAVDKALEFARKDGDTLVLVFPDHNTGGMKVGNYLHEYTNYTVEQFLAPFYNMTMTANGVLAMMATDLNVTSVVNATPAELVEAVHKYWNLPIDEQDAEDVFDYFRNGTTDGRTYQLGDDDGGLSYAMARILSEKYTQVGWTTHGHNAELGTSNIGKECVWKGPHAFLLFSYMHFLHCRISITSIVPMWVYGMSPPQRNIDNTEIAKIIESALGTDLREVTKELYVDLDDIDFLAYTLDVNGTDPSVTVENVARFPFGKDFMEDTSNGATTPLPGVTVYAPMTGKVYVSAQAIESAKGLLSAADSTTTGGTEVSKTSETKKKIHRLGGPFD